ncbi:MAG: hypothetical protein SFX18_03440 [Pirellulales bacterium]|nr:hypothetical protein [Pirellulales bacterium]
MRPKPRNCLSNQSCFLAILLVLGEGMVLAQAQPTKVSVAELRELLDAGWQPSLAALQQSEATYARLLRQHAGDTELDYAYLLTLMRQKKFDEALAHSGKIILVDPAHLPTWRARVWLLTLQKNYAAAIVAAQSLADKLVEKRQPPLPREQARGYCQFLGRVYGYLRGPAAKDVNADKLREAEIKLTGRLGATGSNWFNEGVKEITVKFAASDEELKITKAETIVAENQRKEQQKVILAEQKVNAAAEQQQREAELSQLQAEANAKLDQIDQQLSPAQRQLAAAQANYNAVQVQLIDIDGSLSYWSVAAANALTPFEYDQAIYQIRLLENQRRGVLATLAPLQAQLNSALAQVNQLQAQRDAVVNQYGSQIKALQKRLRELAGQQNRIANEEKKALQPSTGSTTQTLSMAGKVYGFLTYEEFPFEEERQRLVGQ